MLLKSVFELDAADVEGGVPRLNIFKPSGGTPRLPWRRWSYCLRGEILVARLEVLRVHEREKVAVERRRFWLVVANPSFEDPFVADGMGVIQFEGVAAMPQVSLK